MEQFAQRVCRVFILGYQNWTGYGLSHLYQVTLLWAGVGLDGLQRFLPNLSDSTVSAQGECSLPLIYWPLLPGHTSGSCWMCLPRLPGPFHRNPSQPGCLQPVFLQNTLILIYKNDFLRMCMATCKICLKKSHLIIFNTLFETFTFVIYD